MFGKGVKKQAAEREAMLIREIEAKQAAERRAALLTKKAADQGDQEWDSFKSYSFNPRG